MSQANGKTVYIETFGCQMNELDSELIGDRLRALGYRFVGSCREADVVLYNTCSVRENAENKVHGRVGDFKQIKKQRPDAILGVIGCMAERDGGHLVEQYPQIDLLCGPGELDKIPMLIDNAVKTHLSQIALAGHTHRRSGTLSAAADQLELLDLGRSLQPEAHRGSAYVRITRGCNKFCTYCVVPNTRGAEVHRPPDHIVEECKKLADAGVIEITLLGQTVNHYRYDHGAAALVDGREQPQIGPGVAAHRGVLPAGSRITTFADLLRRIHDRVPAVQRLRFVTSYPRSFGDDILQAMADCPRICRYLHVPAQSGSDRILERMNRGYTVGAYRDFIERTRAMLPDVMIASDFIVGFPTETDDDFAQTVELLRWARFKNSFIFKYSPRPGTVAIDKFPDDVPEQTKRRRNVELLEAQAAVSGEVHAEQVGRTLDVFVEGISARARKQAVGSSHFGGAGTGSSVELGWEKAETFTQLSGRTGGDLIVMFDARDVRADALVGQILPVTITGSQPLTLFGRLALTSL